MRLNEEQRREVAESMNHSLATANRFYDFSSRNTSVINSIDLHNSSIAGPSTSTPVKRPHHLDTPDEDGEDTLDDDGEDGDEKNSTLKILRSRKIKRVD